MSDPTDPDPIEIQITCGSVEEAGSIADALVGGHLAACVQQLPIRSTYRWQGQVARDDEILLLVKTVPARFDAVRAVVDGLHSYELPAMTCVAITGGSAEFLDWVRRESTPTT